MYSRILVPMDGSPLSGEAVRHAAEIARATGAEIILFRAVQDSLAGVPEARIGADHRVVHAAAIRTLEHFRALQDALMRSGVKCRFKILEGDPIDTILCMARRERVDAIVMSTHARGWFQRLVKGSVACRVAWTTRRPVMLVKGPGRPGEPSARLPFPPPDEGSLRHAA